MRSTRVLALVTLVAIAAVGFGCSAIREQQSSQNEPLQKQQTTVKFDSEYEAVLLTDGRAFFGKVEGLGTPYPVLRDVYYVQAVPAVEGKPQTMNLLVKRGNETHAPQYMILNADHIVLVEPVGKDSKVAQLIAEGKANMTTP